MPNRYKQSEADRTCTHCGHHGHEHDRVRVVPEDGPPGSYHYKLYCPDS